MGYYKKIDGKNIYLASINLDDAEQYMEWVNKPNVVFDGYKREKIASVEEARNELNDMAVKNVFAVVDKNMNQFLGLTGFANMQAMNQRSHMWIKMSPEIDYNF